MKSLNFLTLVILFVIGCVQTDVIDDMVPEKLEITSHVLSLKIGDSYPLTYRYLNNVGMEESALVEWSSSHEDILSVDAQGVIRGLMKGEVVLTVILVSNKTIMDKISIVVEDKTIILQAGTKQGTIASTSNYALMGDFTVSNISGGVEIKVDQNYSATEALPGLYVYLSNNPKTIEGALEIGAVTVFSGEHSYTVQSNQLTVDTYNYLLYYCKPFNVKVGHGEILD